jgi:DNA-binding transcriptional LysR family regulator
MNIEHIDLNLLRVFDMVYRERSLSRAAVRLGMSQPGISQALQRLRLHLDDPLFIRQAHGVSPTAFSDTLAPPIRQALEKLQAALSTPAARDIRLSQRQVRIAMSDYSQILILAPLMRLLDEQAPHLHIRATPVDGTNLPAALQAGDLDMAIGGIPQLSEQFRQERLFEDDFVCIVRSGHPRIHSTLTLEDYAREKHVGVAVRMATISKIDEACQGHGFQRRIHIVVPDFVAPPFIVAASDAIATLPRRLLRFVPGTLGLQILAPPLTLPRPIVHQYWAERTHQDKLCGWLRSQIHLLCQTL